MRVERMFQHMRLRTKTVKGISWSMASQLGRLVSGFVVLAVLARLLKPSDFGLMAMVAVFTNILANVNDLGLSTAIIHKQDFKEEHLSSAFWFNLLVGIVITAVFLVIAPLIARFYSKIALTPIIMVLSVTFTFTSFGSIQVALFQKRMDFKTLAIVETSASILAGATAIVLAALGFGVWSLVAQALVATFIVAVLAFTLSGWRPKLIFRWRPLWELISYGLHVMGFSITDFFSRNLDNLMIGKFLGSLQLGFYAIAYRLLLFPLGTISNVIGRVVFPALSTIQDDKEAVRNAYEWATCCIGAITFPLMAGLAILAPQLVRVALGLKWERSIFLIQILSLVGLVQSITITVFWIYYSQGRPDTLFKFGLFVAVFYAIAFVIGLRWNVEGVAVSYAIAVSLLIYPAFAIPFRYIDMPFWHFARQFLTIALAVGGMACVVLGVRMLLEKIFDLGDLPVLIIGAVVGATSYLGILMLIDRKLLKGLLEIARDVKARQESAA